VAVGELSWEVVAMYERFSDRARKVMQLANQEALRFQHEYIGTEHILLGLVQEGSGVAANVLRNLDVNLLKLRREVERIVQSGPDVLAQRTLPQTPRAKKVVEYAIEEARSLSHNYVGTEHLLLGLLREQEGVAAQVLLNLGLKLEDVREEVLTILGQETSASPSRVSVTASRPAKEYDLYFPLQDADGSQVDADRLARVEQRLRDQFGRVLRFQLWYRPSLNVGDVAMIGEVILLRVITHEEVPARSFFTRLKAELKAELRQEILIVYRDVEIL
jgi:ATP-dependent Clp protease ATP-binding subunit ClpA